MPQKTAVKKTFLLKTDQLLYWLLVTDRGVAVISLICSSSMTTSYPNSGNVWTDVKSEKMSEKSIVHLFISCWTSLKMCSSSLEVSYSFSMSYSLQGSAHFWACSICFWFRERLKAMPWMLNFGRSQRLDHGFGRIFTLIWRADKNT